MADSVRRGALRRRFLSAAHVLAWLLAVPAGLTAQDAPRVSYARDIQPLLADYCYACHGANRATREADLRLDTRDGAFKDLGAGFHTLVPGKPDESEIYLRVSSEFAEDRMPPYNAGMDLRPDQIDLIKRWIEQGAEWDDSAVQTTGQQTRRRRSGIPAGVLPDEAIVNTHDIAEVKMKVVVRGLSHPWSLAFLPKGDVLITERAGRLRLVRDGVLVSEEIQGLPTDIVARSLSGLMEVAVHPDYEENGWIYLTYTRKLSDTVGTVALVRAKLNGMRLVDMEDVFVAEPWIGNRDGADMPTSTHPTATAAARLAFAPDGKLFMTMGGAFGVEREDGTSSFFGNGLLAQSPDNHAGKLLRLNDDGSAPSDNPFVGVEGAKPEVYSLGHRNQQGLAIHPETGVPYATEHGVQGGDEMNAIEPGGNYGWPVVSYGRHYDGPRISKTFALDGMKPATVFWVPSIAPSGLMFYTGDKFPEWKGNVFAGALMEGRVPGTGHLQRIVFNEKGEEMRREMILAEYRQRIRDVRQGPDGYIYLLTEENEAALIRLEPAPPESSPAP